MATWKCPVCKARVNDPTHPIRCSCGYSTDATSRGLGDTVAKVLKKAGVKQRKGCGCGKRQQKLNEMFPYGK